MDARERFLNCMSFIEVDRVPRWEWGFRPDTTERWHREGLPTDVPDGVGWTEFFGFDRGGGYAGGSMAERAHVSCRLLPDFTGEVIEEDERTRTTRNEWGAVQRSSKVGESIPQYLSFGVRTREDFQEYKRRLDPDAPARYPLDWTSRVRRWHERDYPVCGYAYGWYGILRELMGVEELSCALYEQPALIEEICEFWADFLMRLFRRALEETNVDYILLWEDLAYKNGPLISPRLFRRFIRPHYMRVTDAFRRGGVRFVMVDSDGDIREMIPLWIEGGVNILAPFEVSAGMDVREVRHTYGADLAIVGGIEKIAISRGAKAIDEEVLSRVPPLLEAGGYIPTLDHSPIPEISFDDYRYYRHMLTRVCEQG